MNRTRVGVLNKMNKMRWSLNFKEDEQNKGWGVKFLLQVQEHGDGGNYQWDHLKAPRSMMNMMIR